MDLARYGGAPGVPGLCNGFHCVLHALRANNKASAGRSAAGAVHTAVSAAEWGVWKDGHALCEIFKRAIHQGRLCHSFHPLNYLAILRHAGELHGNTALLGNCGQCAELHIVPFGVVGQCPDFGLVHLDPECIVINHRVHEILVGLGGQIPGQFRPKRRYNLVVDDVAKLFFRFGNLRPRISGKLFLVLADVALLVLVSASSVFNLA